MTRPGPIVLLPPLGHDAALYAPLARALAPALDVVCLDYPGFGGNAALDLAAPDLLERLAQYFVAAIARLSRPPVALGGVSLGGTLSVRLAHLLEPRRTHLFLMGSGGLPVARIRQETVRSAMAELGPEGFVRQHLGVDHPELERSGLAQHLGQVTPAVKAYFAHYFHEIWRAEHFALRARACVAMLDAALSVDYRAEMAAHAGLAHVIWGDRDRVFNHKFVARLSDAFPRAALHVLEGIGHYAPLEAPEQVAQMMLASVRAEETR